MATIRKKPATTKRTYRLSAASARKGLVIKYVEEDRRYGPYRQTMIQEISGRFTLGDVKKIVYDRVHNHIRYASSRYTYPLV